MTRVSASFGICWKRVQSSKPYILSKVRDLKMLSDAKCLALRQELALFKGSTLDREQLQRIAALGLLFLVKRHLRVRVR